MRTRGSDVRRRTDTAGFEGAFVEPLPYDGPSPVDVDLTTKVPLRRPLGA